MNYKVKTDGNFIRLEVTCSDSIGIATSTLTLGEAEDLANDFLNACQELRNANLQEVCPFCRTKNSFVKYEEETFFVECKGCLANGPASSTKEDAIKYWNLGQW